VVKQQNRKQIAVQQTMSYNWGRRRNRLRKGKRGMNTSYWYSSRATYRPIYNKHRTTPEWGALRKAWVGFVIAKSQEGKQANQASFIWSPWGFLGFPGGRYRGDRPEPRQR
jgi:hypothetical protein